MDGIILVNKEKNWTSQDVVAKVKKILHTKVGHTGTLDPNATGVLPLLLGNGTKISKYLINHNKEYIATLKLGIKTDTADGEGKIIEEKQIQLTDIPREKILEILNSFVGKQSQIPPMYSAIKVNGKKLYEYARENKTVEIKAREIEIYRNELLDINYKQNIIIFKVSCSKGTYIRTLCEDIAEKLETVGYMQDLKRVKVGDFDIKDTITIENLEIYMNSFLTIENNNKENINNETSNIERLSNELFFLTIEQIFKDISSIFLKENELIKFLNGVKLESKEIDGIYKIYNQNKFIGIGINKDGKLKRDIII